MNNRLSIQQHGPHSLSLQLLCRVQLVHRDDDGDGFTVETITRDGFDCVEDPLVQAVIAQHDKHR